MNCTCDPDLLYILLILYRIYFYYLILNFLPRCAQMTEMYLILFRSHCLLLFVQIYKIYGTRPTRQSNFQFSIRTLTHSHGLHFIASWIRRAPRARPVTCPSAKLGGGADLVRAARVCTNCIDHKIACAARAWTGTTIQFYLAKYTKDRAP